MPTSTIQKTGKLISLQWLFAASVLAATLSSVKAASPDLDVNINATQFGVESNPGDEGIVRIQGDYVGYIKGGSWIQFNGFDFGTGISTFEVSASSKSLGGRIEARRNSPTGKVIATADVTNTGSWSTYQTFQGVITGDPTGIQPIWLKFVDSSGSGVNLMNLRSFKFKSKAGPSGPPNIIYIMADELGYFQPGFMGQKIIKTPNMDQMAAQGIIMRNMLAGNATCAPSRCSLMTGKHPGHASIRSNKDSSIRADEETIAGMLKKKGYATAGFGKWALGDLGSEGIPENNGFDLFFGYYSQIIAHTYYPSYLVENSVKIPQPGNSGGTNGAIYSAYVIHDRAKQWIQDHANQPFFAYLPYTLPHGPAAIPANDPNLAIYNGLGLTNDQRLIAGMTTLLDTQIGEIVALLKQLGIEDNTLIFISGDNGKEGLFGGNADPNSNFAFRGDKASLYEGGVRVPFLAYWPGAIAGGQSSNHLCYFPDVMATIADATGATVPVESDGLSILPALIGEQAAGHPLVSHEYLYWEHKLSTALRNVTWSLIENNAGWELYNLINDPGQLTNVAAQNPAKVNELKALAAQAHEPQVTGNTGN